MKILLEISDKEINNGLSERFDKPYLLRKAARAVVFNERNEIAFQSVSKHNYYKLPGGGVERGETILEALKREIREEAGCEDIKVIDEIGIIIEYRNKFDILQVSYCYLAETIGKIDSPEYDKAEIEEGLESLWVPMEKAMTLLRNSKPDDYDGKFIVKRDLFFLEELKKTLDKDSAD
jgi:8-oxo-dGTP diphosphatase